MSATEITYHYRGSIERGTGHGYRFVMGYSETIDGKVAYPWMTRAECRAQAKSQGAKACFETCTLLRQPFLDDSPATATVSIP